ncbi:hypothetical protein GCM10010415_55410 [Streptomyces atrovirens]|uniref:Uncharacterized protein n=1 Tax=Streptomyces atrovirens TaxID=285556 RepID=A0ABW0DUX2_9ACTN
MSWSEFKKVLGEAGKEAVDSYPFVSVITDWLYKEDDDALEAIAEYVAGATPKLLEKMDRYLLQTTVNEPNSEKRQRLVVFYACFKHQEARKTGRFSARW